MLELICLRYNDTYYYYYDNSIVFTLSCIRSAYMKPSITLSLREGANSNNATKFLVMDMLVIVDGKIVIDKFAMFGAINIVQSEQMVMIKYYDKTIITVFPGGKWVIPGYLVGETVTQTDN